MIRKSIYYATNVAMTAYTTCMIAETLWSIKKLNTFLML